jgi:hypothetical protein
MLSLTTVATHDQAFYSLIREMLRGASDGPALSIRVAPCIRTASDLWGYLSNTDNKPAAVIVDASIPDTADESPDETGLTTLSLLRQLANTSSTSSLPVLVVLRHPLDDLERYCTTSRSHICLSLGNLSYESINISFERLGLVPDRQRPLARDINVELEFDARVSILRVFDDAGHKLYEKEGFIRDMSTLASFELSRRGSHDADLLTTGVKGSRRLAIRSMKYWWLSLSDKHISMTYSNDLKD